MTPHCDLMTLTNDEPAVDLGALLGRCMGNFDFVERILATFHQSCQKDVYLLREALQGSAFQEIAMICHRFKGAAGTVSSNRLYKLLTLAERLALDENRVDLSGIIGSIGSEWIEFERFAEAFVPGAVCAAEVRDDDAVIMV